MSVALPVAVGTVLLAGVALALEYRCERQRRCFDAE